MHFHNSLCNSSFRVVMAYPGRVRVKDLDSYELMLPPVYQLKLDQHI